MMSQMGLAQLHFVVTVHLATMLPVHSRPLRNIFGASMHMLLQVCQVAYLVLLPPLYQTMVDYGKKNKIIPMQ
jgi:hypothetical protein